jgi:hypothetical protein
MKGVVAMMQQSLYQRSLLATIIRFRFMMVTQSHLRERLKDRLQELVHELRSDAEAMPQEYISEVLGEEMNGLYRILDFPTKQNFVKYLFLAGLVNKKMIAIVVSRQSLSTPI